MEFTPEQQAHIDTLIAEKTTGLFGEEELKRRVTAETDRRVESGIQKGLETHKKKWEEEYKTQANLTAEELAKKKLDEKMIELTKKEKEILKKSNTLNAKDLLATAEVPKAHYDKFIGLLVSEDETSTNNNVQNFIDTFNATKLELETSIKKQYSNVPPPKIGNGDGVISKEEFIKLPYLEKMKLKTNSPDIYKTLMA